MLHQHQEVVQAARRSLSKHCIPSLRSCEVRSIDGGSIVIRGAVHSYYQKQLAQETVRAVCHGIHIVNELEVNMEH